MKENLVLFAITAACLALGAACQHVVRERWFPSPTTADIIWRHIHPETWTAASPARPHGSPYVGRSG